MADHSLPVQTSGYLNFVQEMDNRFDDLARGLDPSKSPVGDPNITNLPVNSVGWSSETGNWRKWNGSTWVPLITDNLYNINISGNAATVTDGVYLSSTQTITGTKTFTNIIIGSINGNSATVTNGVYTVGDQSIAGVKTFTSTIVGSINGNSATVTNGVYTVGDQTIAGVKTFSSTIIGSISGNAGTVTNGVYTTGAQTIAGVKTFSSTIVGSISGNAATANSATNSTNAANLVTSNWTINEVSGALYFKYNGVTKFVLDSNGSLFAGGEVSAGASI